MLHPSLIKLHKPSQSHISQLCMFTSLRMPRSLCIILVVGAWHVEGHAKPITPYLETHGYRVVPIKLQTSSQHDPPPVIQDNVAPIVAAIKSEISSGNKVCLVGHSVSGQSCVLAANDFLSSASTSEKASFVHIAFISCFLNPVRTLEGADWYDIDFSTMWAHLRTPDEIYSVLYNDMPRGDAQPFIDMLDSNRAQMPPDDIPNTWKQVPGTYFVCLKDKAVLPERQRLEADDMGMSAVEVDMDHCCFVSRPRDFAEELHKLVRDL